MSSCCLHLSLHQCFLFGVMTFLFSYPSLPWKTHSSSKTDFKFHLCLEIYLTLLGDFPSPLLLFFASIRLGWFTGRGNGNPLQYSCLKNPMDRGVQWATVHGVTKSRTRLSDFTFTITTNALILTLSHRITTIISYLDFLLPTSNPFTFPSTFSTLQSRVLFLKHSPVTSIPTSKFSQILLPQNKI